MRKIKILFFIHDLSYGGAEKVLVNLVNNMSQNNFDITVQTIFDVGINRNRLNSNIKYKPGLPIMFRGNSHLFKIFSPTFLAKIFVKEDYDIIVSYLEGPTARIISGYNNEKTKKICWIHTDLIDSKLFSTGFRNLKEAKESYLQFDKIICVSESVKSSFIKMFMNKKLNIEVIYNVNESDVISNLALEPIDFKPKYFSICSVGKIQPNKGYLRLAKVHKQLIEEGITHQIFIIGTGPQEKEIIDYLDKNRLRDTFVFLGFQNNPYKYMKHCNLYLCSSYREGLNTAVTEALILGIPVLSTLCSGARELLGNNNEFGLVVENSDEAIYRGIKYLIQNNAVVEEYKKRSLKRGKSFSKRKIVLRTELMFNHIVNNT